MSDLLDRLRAATEGVTEGPWRVSDIHLRFDIGPVFWIVKEDDQPGLFTACKGRDDEEREANTYFIAAARTLIPEAADRIAALEAEVARLWGANANLQRLCQHYEARLSPRAALGDAKP